jgi:hypothetical protein
MQRAKDMIDGLVKDGVLPLSDHDSILLNSKQAALMLACDNSEMFLHWLSVRKNSLHQLFIRDLMAVQSSVSEACPFLIAMLDCVESGTAVSDEVGHEFLLAEIKERLERV